MSEPPEFIGNDVLIPWNTLDSDPATPQEYYGVRFNADLSADSTALLTKYTLHFSPNRYLRDGKVYLVARVNSDGVLVASLADGNIPTAIAPRPAPRNARQACPEAPSGSGAPFDVQGRLLDEKASALGNRRVTEYLSW